MKSEQIPEEKPLAQNAHKAMKARGLIEQAEAQAIPPHVLKQTASAVEHNRKRIMQYCFFDGISDTDHELMQELESALDGLTGVVKKVAQSEDSTRAFIIGNLLSTVIAIASGKENAQGGRFDYGSTVNYMKCEDGRVVFIGLKDDEPITGDLNDEDMEYLKQIIVTERFNLPAGVDMDKPVEIMLNGNPMPEHLYRVDKGVIYFEIRCADL